MSITDTTVEARHVMYDLYRRMTPARKFRLICEAYRFGQSLAMAGIRMQNPNLTEKEIWHIWAKRHLGEKLYNEVYGNPRNRNLLNLSYLTPAKK